MIARRRLLLLPLILIPFVAPGCTGYATHLEAWKDGSRQPLPPPELASIQRPSAPRSPEPGPPPPPPESEEVGFSLSLPDPELLAALAPAASDPEFALRQLGAGFTLPQLEALLLLRNPELRAAEAEYQGVRERYSQTAAVNDLLARYAAFTGRESAGLYPFPGSVALRGEVVREEVAAARETRELILRNLLANTRRAYWELRSTRQAQANALNEFDVVDSLKNTTANGYAAGSAPLADLLQVDIDHGTMKTAIPVQQEALRVKETALLALLDLEPGAAIGAPAETPPERQPPRLAGIVATALQARQELRILRRQIAKTELLIALSENEFHPGYTLNLAAFPARDASRVVPGGARPESFATAPAPPGNAFTGLYEGYLRETRQTLAALRQRLANEEAQTRSLVQEAWFNLDRASQEERVYREKIVPLSQAGIDAANSAFAAGQASHGQLLATYSKWFGAILARERAQANLGAAWATLEERVGARIPAPAEANESKSGK